jgi:hypothetical protein
VVDSIEVVARTLVVGAGDYSIRITPVRLHTGGSVMVLDVLPRDVIAHADEKVKKVEWDAEWATKREIFTIILMVEPWVRLYSIQGANPM